MSKYRKKPGKRVRIGSIVKTHGIRGQGRVDRYMKTIPDSVWVEPGLGGWHIWQISSLVPVERLPRPKKGRRK
jgi:hypothetical protein